jgi:inosose dehydratase
MNSLTECSASTNLDASALIGQAPDSWGVWNPEDRLQPPASQYLKEVSEAGYHWTELGPYGYLGVDAHELHDKLVSHDLEVTGGTVFVSLHTGPAALDDDWQRISEIAHLTQEVGGAHVVVLPGMWQRRSDGSVEGHRSLDAVEWGYLLANHNELGKRLRDEFGLSQEFHPHAETAVGSPSEVMRLLENTDPDYLSLCFDTGHYAYYLGDSLAFVRRFSDRIGYLHVKQIDPAILPDVHKCDLSFAEAVARGIVVEAPTGKPDVAEIITLVAKRHPGIFAVIEQDMYPLPSFDVPLPIARRTLDYLLHCGAPVRVR